MEFRFYDSPPEIIPPTVLVIINLMLLSIALFMGITELTCPLNSVQHMESAHDRKQSKPDYEQQLLAELNISTCYRIVKVSSLGHFSPFSITNQGMQLMVWLPWSTSN